MRSDAHTPTSNTLKRAINEKIRDTYLTDGTSINSTSAPGIFGSAYCESWQNSNAKTQQYVYFATV
jgi:hypothetical protein